MSLETSITKAMREPPGRIGYLPAVLMLAALAASAACTDPSTSSGTPVTVRPGELVFSGMQGQSCDALQEVAVTSRSGEPVAWEAQSSMPWLRLSADSGVAPAAVTASVDCAGLAAGIHEATLSVSVGEGRDVKVDARLVINPATPVTLATWKDGARGAFSVSTDDGHQSGFTELLNIGRAGTFVMNGTASPAFYPPLLESGMELGAHLVTHYCQLVDEPRLRYEIEANVEGLARLTQAPEGIITLVWPCGFTSRAYQAIAAEYFLSARGYNINQLEEPTPANLMNLRSFNSHEHEPFPPADLKSIVDAAEAGGKWANLVLHAYNNDDGAIAYAARKDLWIAPIGSVIKYILQRDRTFIEDYAQDASALRFSFSRLPIAGTVRREFEPVIGPEDEVSFRVDLSSLPLVGPGAVTVAGRSVPHHVKEEGGGRYLYFSTAVTAQKQVAQISLDGTAITQLSSGVRTSAGTSGPAPVRPARAGFAAPAGARTYRLNYPDRAALLADGWDFLARSGRGEARDTEFAQGAALVFSPWGSLRVPADVGDLSGLNATRNSLFRDLPAGWSSVIVALDFRPLQESQQAGVAIYGSDADYVLLARELRDGHRIALMREEAGAQALLGSQPVTATDGLLLRLDRDAAAASITGSFSLDAGATWVDVGTVAQALRNPRLALITGGLQARHARQRDNLNAPGYIDATYHAVHVVTGGASRVSGRP